MSGVSVGKGTRVPVEAIEVGMELGQTPEQLAYDYRLDVDKPSSNLLKVDGDDFV